MPIAIISHPDCALHNPNPYHPESPARIKVIDDAIKQFPFNEKPVFYQSRLATFDELCLAHDKAYVETLYDISPAKGEIQIDPDTSMNAATLNAARLAAGAVILGIDKLMQTNINIVFCNIRPPGHHATKNNAIGFCFFNNVMIGVMYAIKNYHLQRVAIIDFDVHHGNGTQDIMQHDERILLCSSFQAPFYPGYQGERDNEHILSIPLNAGTNGTTYRQLVSSTWLPKLHEFKPQLIFFSAGFDAHQNDPWQI